MDQPTHAPDYDHAAWVRTKMYCLVLEALSDLEDVADAAQRYGVSADTPKELRHIVRVCEGILKEGKRDAA